MNTDKIYAEAVANEYSAKKTSKVIALKKLDRKAKEPARIFALSFGIISALVLGIGMCLSMHIIGPGDLTSSAAGIAIGVLGIAGAGANYFIYKRVLEKGKQKYANDIIMLAKEISEEQ